MARGPQNKIYEIDYSDPARPCRCGDPAADPRDMTCIYCGHQVGGVPVPSRVPAFSLNDRSSYASKTPRRGAAL